MSSEASERAIGRSLGFERGLVVVVGVLALLLGALVLVIGAGLLGQYRARRPVLDPLLVDWWTSSPWLAVPVAVIAGLLLLVIGLLLLRRILRPEPRPHVHLDGPAGTLTVTASAVADAVRADAESIDQVERARARLTGSTGQPALRLTLRLREGTNVREVWQDLDDRVLLRARQALGVSTLPTAIRLELDRAPRQRTT